MQTVIRKTAQRQLDIAIERGEQMFGEVHYYDQPKDTIYIIDLWDTRREPQSLSKHIRG